jgi:hypothetical protein
MTLGEFGSTLNDELNRLANGGTYRDMNQMVDEALAAKQWANRENINPYSTDTVGILNEIAGLGLDKRNWLDFNGVCNYIAGTTGLPAAAALRQVYNTTDLLTSQSAYYVDATTPTNWGSLGFVRLNGVTGNYLSVPDATNLDITGDIDIRAQVSLDDWTPATAATVIAKEQTTTTRSYRLTVNTSGTLSLFWTTDGTTLLTATSTIAPTVADGATLWIRATLDVNNGASGRDIQFFTSNDGSSWTQLGTTVTQAGTTSIYSGTSQIEIGSRVAGTTEVMTGNFYRAQVLDGIGGTTVLDVNIATDYKASNEDTFTATTGQTVTVNGVDTIANLGTAGSLLPTTLGSSTAADSNDPKFLDHTGTNYVYLPGVTTSFLSVPNDSPVQITGDIDVRQWVALDDWTPSSDNEVGSKTGGAGSRGWIFQVISTGALRLTYSADGTTLLTRTSTATISAADGSNLWVRFTLDVDNGAGSNETKFFTSTDGTNWTQLGATVTNAGTTSIFNTPAVVRDNGGSTSKAGKLYRFQIFASIDGTDKRLDVDTSVITAGSATSFTAVTGQTVTINRSASGRKTVAVTQPTWLFGTDDYMEVNNRYMASGTYLYLPGTGTNHASAPDAAALDITGDIDLRAKVSLDDWTPSGSNALVAKYGTAGQRSYMFQVASPSGVLQLNWSADGTNVITKNSTVAPTIADGATLWVRATLDVNNGASGNDVTFYTSTDGTTWTQLGATVTTAGTTSIFSGTSILEVGTWAGGNSIARGKFFRAQVLNGIDGTVAFDANFETSITSLNQTSFTESSVNAATVTINRSGSTYRSAGITAAGYLYPGATNTFTASATDFFNFSASQSISLIAIFRQWATNSTFRGIVSKLAVPSTSSLGYQVGIGSPSTNTYLQFTDGVTAATTTNFASGVNELRMIGGVLDRENNFLKTFTTTGDLAATSGTIPAYGIEYPIGTFTIGSRGAGSANVDGEIVAVAFFRRALNSAQTRQIYNYFANREVYL